MYCDSSGKVITSRKQLYKKLVSEGYFAPVPKPEDIEWRDEWGNKDRLERAIEQYENIRRELFLAYGFQYVDIGGKIQDEAFMALIISAEFGMHKNKSIYNEALEALSNQYFSAKPNPGPMQCNANCTVTGQILWASQMEGLYGPENFTDDHIITHIPHPFEAEFRNNRVSLGNGKRTTI